LIGGTPTSDLKMCDSRQTDRFTDCARSVRESSPRTSSLIFCSIFSTLLSKPSHPRSCGEQIFNQQLPVAYASEVNIGLTGQTYSSNDKLSWGTVFNSQLRGATAFENDYWEAPFQRSRLNTIADKNLSTGKQICNDFERFVYINMPDPFGNYPDESAS